MISHNRFVLVSRCGQQTAVPYFHDVPENWNVKVFMVKLLIMQKRPSLSATKEEICDEPIVQKLFEDAIEVLRIAGAYGKDTGKHSAILGHSIPLLLIEDQGNLKGRRESLKAVSGVGGGGETVSVSLIF